MDVGDIKIPCSLPPTKVLKRLIKELKHPATSLKGWSHLLYSVSENTEIQQDPSKHFELIANSLKVLIIDVKQYLNECHNRIETLQYNADISSIEAIRQISDQLQNPAEKLMNLSRLDWHNQSKTMAVKAADIAEAIERICNSGWGH